MGEILITHTQMYVCITCLHVLNCAICSELPFMEGALYAVHSVVSENKLKENVIMKRSIGLTSKNGEYLVMAAAPVPST